MNGNDLYQQGYSAAHAPVEARAAFITQTYLHLFGAIVLFMFMEAGLLFSGAAAAMINGLAGMGRLAGFVILGAFMGATYIAERFATSENSRPLHYVGLLLFTAAEAVIFAPIMLYAALSAPGVIGQAALITLTLFGSLTGIVFVTRKDFQFMRGILYFAGLAAMGLIFCSLIFGFTLGILFSWVMLVLACGYILYHTSNVMLRYRTDQPVAAALALFSSVMLLLWYVMRILLARRR